MAHYTHVIGAGKYPLHIIDGVNKGYPVAWL
jgi:hypothetical protein